ncbi:MAG: hypothetical protein JWP66_1739 [Naasia sp.]|nr:hypothetical protein [Naasia sp.]
MHLSLPSRIAAAGSAALLLALAGPLAASAHVSVDPAQAEAGGYSQLTFRVPNERDDAGTVRLAVSLPADTPFASVSYEPVPGWTTSVVTTELPEPVEVNGNQLTEAVTSIVWEADAGGRIEPGQFLTFPISVGPVPEVGSVALPATQTYSNGEVVEWAGDEDADLPAPVLYVGDEPAGHGHSGGEGDDPADTADTASVSSTGGTTPDDGLARGLGIIGLALGALALVLAAFSLMRNRRT